MIVDVFDVISRGKPRYTQVTHGSQLTWFDHLLESRHQQRGRFGHWSLPQPCKSALVNFHRQKNIIGI